MRKSGGVQMTSAKRISAVPEKAMYILYLKN